MTYDILSLQCSCGRLIVIKDAGIEGLREGKYVVKCVCDKPNNEVIIRNELISMGLINEQE